MACGTEHKGGLMLLEIKVLSSAEWYEKVIPLLQRRGFVAREDLQWADPETDGEYMGYYYDYQGNSPLAYEDLAALIKQIKAIIRRGEAPLIDLALVTDR
jgi:hypothetical protein